MCPCWYLILTLLRFFQEPVHTLIQSRWHGNTSYGKLPSERCWPRQRYCFHSRHLYYCSLPPSLPTNQAIWALPPIFLCHPSIADSHSGFPAPPEYRDVTVHEWRQINLPFDGKCVVVKVSERDRDLETEASFHFRRKRCIYFNSLLYRHPPTASR